MVGQNRHTKTCCSDDDGSRIHLPTIRMAVDMNADVYCCCGQTFCQSIRDTFLALRTTDIGYYAQQKSCQMTVSFMRPDRDNHRVYFRKVFSAGDCAAGLVCLVMDSRLYSIPIECCGDYYGTFTVIYGTFPEPLYVRVISCYVDDNRTPLSIL